MIKSVREFISSCLLIMMCVFLNTLSHVPFFMQKLLPAYCSLYINHSITLIVLVVLLQSH